MNENVEYNTIEFKDLVQNIKKHIMVIIFVPIIFAAIGAAVSIYFIDPVYESSTTLIVIQEKSSQEEINLGDVNLSKSLIYTYTEMAKSNTVLENTKEMLGLESLNADTIRVFPVEDTQILKVVVQNTDPQLAMDIANVLVEEFTLEIVRITKTNNVSVVDYASIPQDPVKPNTIINSLVAAFLGGVIVLLSVFFMDYLDNTVKSEKDIEILTGISVIGEIPNFSQGSKQAYGTYGKVHG